MNPSGMIRRIRTALLMGATRSYLRPTANARMVNLIRGTKLASSVLLMLPRAWRQSVNVLEFVHRRPGIGGMAEGVAWDLSCLRTG